MLAVALGTPHAESPIRVSRVTTHIPRVRRGERRTQGGLLESDRHRHHDGQVAEYDRRDRHGRTRNCEPEANRHGPGV